MVEGREISDIDLIRVLGEYTGKAQTAYQRYSFTRGWVLSALVATATLGVGVLLTVADFGAPAYLVAAPMLALIWGLSNYLSKLGEGVQIAVWQLRRIYELVSRREDLGVDLDSGSRLELELRLGEAGFTLTELERFDKPEKFRHFNRVGSASPFRVLEPSDSPWIKPRATQTDEPAPPPTPPGPPDSLASPS